MTTINDNKLQELLDKQAITNILHQCYRMQTHAQRDFHYKLEQIAEPISGFNSNRVKSWLTQAGHYGFISNGSSIQAAQT